MQKMELKMTFFGMTANKVATVHHFQKNGSATEGSMDKLSD
jgi:hypothetical protein